MNRDIRLPPDGQEPREVGPAMVTGCAGFIGSHLTEALLAKGIDVLGVDCFNDNYGRREKLRNLELARGWSNFAFVPVDLARGQLEDLVADCGTIFHLAAEPGVRSSWSFALKHMCGTTSKRRSSFSMRSRAIPRSVLSTPHRRQCMAMPSASRQAKTHFQDRFHRMA